MNKKELFFYFVLMLKRNYEIINPTLKLNRYHILKMLFIATVKDNRLLEELGDGLNFNNFYALPKGPVESDCYNYIYKLENFEIFIEDENNINQENNIDKEIKNIIQEATLKIGSHLYEKDENYLIDYTHTFKSWQNAWLKANIYGKKAFYIEPNDIKNDRAY